MRPVRMPPLRELRFGQLDASQEAIDEPQLLTDGFFDFRSAAYSIAARQCWLLLGPKGAGKSAVLQHLRLIWADRYDRFFVDWDLRNFPVSDAAKIQTGQTQGGSRAESSWKFLILLRVVESMARDTGMPRSREFDKLHKGLQAAAWLRATGKVRL